MTFDNLSSNSDTSRRIETSEGNSIRIDRPTALVAAHSRVDFMLTLDALKQETLEEYFDIVVRDSDTSLFMQVIGEIQKPRVCLNRNKVTLGKIYAGVQEKIESDHKQSIVLKNYGNLPATFQWEEIVNPERLIIRFEPRRGVIQPKSEVRINFNLTLYYGGIVDELFICNIDDLEIPLGFEFAAESFGLNVSHEIAPDVAAKMNQTKSNMNNTMTSLNSSFSEVQNKTGMSSPLMGMFGMNLLNKL